MSDEPARLFEVEGETFRVSGSMPGHMRFEWLTGPHEGYGFNSASSRATNEMITDDVIARSIRNFLSGIDPPRATSPSTIDRTHLPQPGHAD